MANFPIACICGSTSQREQMTELNRQLTMEGKIVVAPGVFQHDGDPLTEDQKIALDKLHFAKINMADEVHIIQKLNGSLGYSTARELEYAQSLSLKVMRYDATLSSRWEFPPFLSYLPGSGPIDHGFTPGNFSPDTCQVMLARYPCPYPKQDHDPRLPPEDINSFGYRRKK